jgi:hypothetical protein
VIKIGQSLQSEGILWVGTTVTLLLVVVYLFVLACHVRAIWKKKIWFPGKDEDAQHSDPWKIKGVDEEARMHKHE